MKRLLIMCILSLLLIVPAAAQAPALRVVATTTIVADVARNVGGDRVAVEALIPPDADGHAWQPTPADVVKVAQADLLLVVGVDYETFLGTLLETAGDVPQIVVSRGVPILPFIEPDHQLAPAGAAHEDEAAGEHASELEPVGLYGDEGVCEAHDDEAADGSQPEDHAAEEAHDHGACDPHVWTDPTNVMIWAQNIAEALAAADPAGAEAYRANAAAYRAQLEALDAEVAAILEAVPAERRILVTNHEFLLYFAHRYDFQVIGGILGASTLDEPDPQTLLALVEQVKALAVPAIFAEVSASTRFTDVVASEAGARVVSDLYSESLSGADGPASTYLDYLRYNARRIAEALSA